MAIITGTLLEDQYSFVIISRSVLLRMRKVSDKNCRENHNSHFMLNNVFFRKSWRLWDNVEKYCTAGQATDGNWCTDIAWWIPKATATHSGYVTHFFSTAAVTGRTCLTVRHTYIACLVITQFLKSNINYV